MRVSLRTVCFVFVLAVCSVAEGTGSPEMELKFAQGLSKLGYYDLSAQQFRKLDWSKQKDPVFRGQVAEGLIDTYFAAAKAAESPVEALRCVNLASEEIRRFPKDDFKPEQRNDFWMREGDTLMELGRLAREVYLRGPRGVNLVETATQGEGAFRNAKTAYQAAVAGFKSVVKEVEAKADVNDADRILRRKSLTQQFTAETQIGWSHFRLGKLLLDQKKKAPAEKEFVAAVEILRALRTTHHEIAAGLSAALGQGLCEQELGRHAEAIKSFAGVLECRRTENTIPVRFRAWYETAASQATLGQFRDALDALTSAREEYDDLPAEMADAWQFRHAETLGQAADALRKQSEENEKKAKVLRAKGDQKSRGEAEALKRKAEAGETRCHDLYTLAAREARKLANSEGAYSQEAILLLGKWAAAGRIDKRFRSAMDCFAEGERLLEAGKPADAIRAYREAIRRNRSPRGAKGKLCLDSWVQTANAYMALQNHYEAGMVLGYVARVYPDCAYAEKAAVYSAMLLGAQYQKGRTPYEADLYLQAQELLVEQFPATDAARRAAFRLADVRRAQKDYEGATRYYLKVNRASLFYEKASYLAGMCLWEAFIEKQKAGVEADLLAARAENQLQVFMAWTDEQPAGNTQADKERPLWKAMANVLLAEMAIHQKRYADALGLLNERTMAELMKLPEDRDSYLARARLQRLRALCTLGGIANVQQAGKEIEALRRITGVTKETQSTAGRLVGMTFLKMADERMAGAKSAGVSGNEFTRDLLANARKHLILSVELNPEQTIEQYSEVASALAQSGAHAQAAAAFEHLVVRFGNDPVRREAIIDARRWVGICYKRAGDWRKAAVAFETLKNDFPKWMSARRELAECYESDALKRYADAEKLWRTIEQNCEMGQSGWFEARCHRVRMLALAKRKDLAFQMLATTALSYPALGGKAWEQQFLAVVEAQFDKEKREAFHALRNDILATEE